MSATNVPLIAQLLARPFAELKARRVERGGLGRFFRTSTLASRAELLRKEFLGQSEMLLYHAILMMLIRRDIDLAQNVERARSLWRDEHAYLITNLNSRWLVSACDTVADHGQNPTDRAWAMAGSLFVNTVKLYETERWASGQSGPDPVYREVTGTVPLYDGLTGFAIGRGDMVRNLLRRTAATAGDGVGALIFRELMRRALTNDTVFKRFAAAHQNPDTAW